MNQTRLTVTAPSLHDPGDVTATVILDSGQALKASPEAWLGITSLLSSAIRKKWGRLDALEWSAEPIGPQVRLASLNGVAL
jgi:hypothetical protein